MNEILMFDPGHAKNTWPPSKGVYKVDGSSFAEHTFNIAVAKAAEVKAVLNGFKVIYTQDQYDTDDGLGKRTAKANAIHKVTPVFCYLSLHANASANKKAEGHGVFHFFNSKVSQKFAEIWDKYADQLLPNKNWGATGVWQSLREGWTKMMALYATHMPAILIEHFFFTNPDELAMCEKQEYIDMCAEVLIRAMSEMAGRDYIEEPEADLEEQRLPLGEIGNKVEAAMILLAEVKELLQEGR